MENVSKTSNQILQDDETIVLQESCAYCKDGTLAAVNEGNVILTDKRFIIAKNAASKLSLAVTVSVVIVVAVLLVILPKKRLGYMEMALIGAIAGGVIAGIGAMINKASTKKKTGNDSNPSGEIVVSFERENIASVEDGSRGVRKMLVVNFKDGSLYKVGVKDRESWRSALING
jgi:hypothetical protein